MIHGSALSELSDYPVSQVSQQRLRPFVPSRLAATTPVVPPALTVDSVSYRRRVVGQDAVEMLGHDPSHVEDPSLVRLTLNIVSTFVAITAFGLGIAATSPTLLGYDSVVVASGSMEPAIRVADIVLTTPSDGLNLGEGSVINYDHAGETQLHRVVGIEDTGYRTAGDANRNPDSDIVHPSQVRGVGIVVVPYVGRLQRWAVDGMWLQLGLTLGVLVAALHMSRAAWVQPHRKVTES